MIFRQGASFFTGGEDWQDNVEIDGKGTVYGTEFLLKKNTGKFNGGWHTHGQKILVFSII